MKRTDEQDLVMEILQMDTRELKHIESALLSSLKANNEDMITREETAQRVLLILQIALRPKPKKRENSKTTLLDLAKSSGKLPKEEVKFNYFPSRVTQMRLNERDVPFIPENVYRPHREEVITYIPPIKPSKSFEDKLADFFHLHRNYHKHLIKGIHQLQLPGAENSSHVKKSHVTKLLNNMKTIL